MWYQYLAEVENPGREDLRKFIHLTRKFLGDVVHDEKFYWLWNGYEDLRELAFGTYRRDISEGPGLVIDEVIDRIPPEALKLHGLVSEPLHFKFKVIAKLDEEFTDFLPDPIFEEDPIKVTRQKLGNIFNVREWFKKLITAIDATLDSILKCADIVLPGAGGIIKEFKDTILSLA